MSASQRWRSRARDAGRRALLAAAMSPLAILLSGTPAAGLAGPSGEAADTPSRAAGPRPDPRAPDRAIELAARRTSAARAAPGSGASGMAGAPVPRAPDMAGAPVPRAPDMAGAPVPRAPGMASRPAAPSGAQEIEKVEEVDVGEVDVEEVDVEEVEPGQVPGAGAGSGSQAVPFAPGQQQEEPGLWALVGRMHPALVHFPIAWLVLLLVVDLRTLAFRREGWERLGLYLLVGTTLAFVPTVATGLLRADELPQNERTLSLIAEHRNLAYITGGVVLAALVLRLARRNRLEGLWRWAYLALIGAAAVLVLWVGHRGARMVFGVDFLPF